MRHHTEPYHDEEDEENLEDIRHMLLGDAYADIMLARQILDEHDGDTTYAEEDIEVYRTSLELLESIVLEADPRELLEEAENISREVDNIILNLNRR